MQDEPQQAPPLPQHVELLLSVHHTQFQDWRHHPLTAAYLKYLEDLNRSFRKVGEELWLRPRDGNVDAAEVRGRVLLLDELADLTIGDIRRFYLGESSSDEGTSENAG